MNDSENQRLQLESILKQQLKQGFLWEFAVSEENIVRLLSSLIPYKTDHELIRIGAKNDGGYLIPNDLTNIEACFSPGVDNRATFENDLFEKFAIPSHLADFSSSLTSSELNVSSLTKKYLGSVDDTQHISLESWMNKSIQNINHSESDFLLQMDIEGNEYQTILACPKNYLKKFRIIVMEIHWLINWCKGSFYKIADAFMKKLTDDFYVVHTHLNNGGTLSNIRGIDVPLVVEVTFLRKDRVALIQQHSGLPHSLDMPNNKNLPELAIPHWLLNKPIYSHDYFDVNSIRQF